MPNPAFIVDGYTEQNFIRNICPGTSVQRTNLNGKGVTMGAIAKKVASMIRLFGNRHYPIIILIDREERRESCNRIIQELHEQQLRVYGVTDQDLRIGVADRMIENWIIADFKLIADIAKRPPNTDGMKGASIIKQYKRTYSRVVDGTKLLLSMDKSIVYQESPSYKNFIDKLEDIDCQYLQFTRSSCDNMNSFTEVSEQDMVQGATVVTVEVSSGDSEAINQL